MSDDNQTPSTTGEGTEETMHPQASGADAEPERSAPEDAPERSDGNAHAEVATSDPRPALRKLIELAVEYPKIGPPLAELAFQIGQTELGNRVMRMGLDQDGPGLEYYFVAAHSARREQRYADARRLAVEAIRAFVRTPEPELADDDGERLLHLVRLGYSTMLFDEKDPRIDPSFVEQLREELPTLEPRLGNDPFYQTLLAQTWWYEDVDKSEAAWDRAAAADSTESTWNARGTWYKDAVKDLDKAEQAYRKGLEVVPTSPLLLHNLAQLLVDMAERPDVDLDKARRYLRNSEQLLRAALREESPKGLRRHVHATRDRLMALRASFPPRGANAKDNEDAEPEREPEPGEVIVGRIRSLAAFGAFVVLPGRGTGLLHKSEIAHDPVDDPGSVLEVGQEIEVKVVDVSRKDGKLRIALSKKALLPKPPPAADGGGRKEAAQDRKTKPGRGKGKRDDARDRDVHRGKTDGRGRGSGRGRDEDKKLASLGEMLWAKMNQQKKDD